MGPRFDAAGLTRRSERFGEPVELSFVIRDKRKWWKGRITNYHPELDAHCVSFEHQEQGHWVKGDDRRLRHDETPYARPTKSQIAAMPLAAQRKQPPARAVRPPPPVRAKPAVPKKKASTGGKYTCDGCGRDFDWGPALASHLRSNTCPGAQKAAAAAAVTAAATAAATVAAPSVAAALTVPFPWRQKEADRKAAAQKARANGEFHCQRCGQKFMDARGFTAHQRSTRCPGAPQKPPPGGGGGGSGGGGVAAAAPPRPPARWTAAAANDSSDEDEHLKQAIALPLESGPAPPTAAAGAGAQLAHECRECDQMFRRVYELLAHKRRVHGGAPVSKKSRKALIEAAVDAGTYDCARCGRRFPPGPSIMSHRKANSCVPRAQQTAGGGAAPAPAPASVPSPAPKTKAAPVPSPAGKKAKAAPASERFLDESGKEIASGSGRRLGYVGRMLPLLLLLLLLYYHYYYCCCYCCCYCVYRPLVRPPRHCCCCCCYYYYYTTIL